MIEGYQSCSGLGTGAGLIESNMPGSPNTQNLNIETSGINYLLAKKLKNKSSPKASYLSKQEREKLIEGFFESNEKLVRSLELSEEIRFKLNHID